MSSNFMELVKAAKAQPEPQRLLFLLAQSERSNKAHKSNAKGTITPVMCVDKEPEELTGFSRFVSEADSMSKNWDMMLVAGMNGEGGKAPTTEDAEPLLNKMANDLMSGQDLSRYLILDRNEDQVNILQNCSVRRY